MSSYLIRRLMLLHCCKVRSDRLVLLAALDDKRCLKVAILLSIL